MLTRLHLITSHLIPHTCFSYCAISLVLYTARDPEIHIATGDEQHICRTRSHPITLILRIPVIHLSNADRYGPRTLYVGRNSLVMLVNRQCIVYEWIAGFRNIMICSKC
jgi:hypothetical protein